MVVRIMSSFTKTQNFLTQSKLSIGTSPIIEDVVSEPQLQIQLNTYLLIV